jgi:hypothetical protein
MLNILFCAQQQRSVISAASLGDGSYALFPSVFRGSGFLSAFIVCCVVSGQVLPFMHRRPDEKSVRKGMKDEKTTGKRIGKEEHQGIKYMAKILMMAGSIIVVLSLLGFLVLLLKGRAVTKTSPV